MSKPVKLSVLLVAGCIVLLAAVYYLQPRAEKTEITTDTMSGDNGRGKIIEGNNLSKDSKVLKTADRVVYESDELASPAPHANAAILEWGQDGQKGEVGTSFRVHDGKDWSSWVESDSDNEGKDGAPATHAALVLGSSIHKIQYRFEVLADKTTRLSPEVDLTSASIELVDTTKGPSPTKKQGFVGTILQKINPFKRAAAQDSGRRVISRAEWGAPEPNSSPRWTPEYRRLDRVIVHHTAMVNSGDSAAAVRAVWYFHANSQDWGDIGYNYLVDQNGNIFEGRYYDRQYAELHSEDVVGGHASSHNYGSVGISALGDFTNSQPTERMMDAIASMAAFKLYRYGIHPTSWRNGMPAVVGHRDMNQTSCPGNLHNHLPTIRTWASREYDYYNSRPFSAADQDVVKSMNSPTVYLVQSGQLRPISTAGLRDCYIMANGGRIKSVTDGHIASMPKGSAAGACTPSENTWFYNQSTLQQYVLLYGGVYPVGAGDVVAMGAGAARPLGEPGVEYLQENYGEPEIPGHILVKGTSASTVYESLNDSLAEVTSSETRNCLIAQLGQIKNIPDSLINSYRAADKIDDRTVNCTITKGQIMHPNGTIAHVVSGGKRIVNHPSIRSCIMGRTGTAAPYTVSQSTWDSFTTNGNAFCPYASTVHFIKEADEPTVWLVLSDGRKQHANGFCVPDPFTTGLHKYRVSIVPTGETSGHTYDGVFGVTAQSCNALE